MLELQYWMIPVLIIVVACLMYGSILVGIRVEKYARLSKNGGTKMNKREEYIGSSSIDDLLKTNAELLPNDVRKALLKGHSVTFKIRACIRSKKSTEYHFIHLDH